MPARADQSRELTRTVLRPSGPSRSRALPSRATLLGRALLLVAGIAVFAGCGSKNADRLAVFPVAGQVKFNGQPLPNAFVVLHPRGAVSPKAMSARGQTDQQGNFKVTTYDAADGAPAGEYAVTVAYHALLRNGDSYQPGPNVLPPKYATPETTDVIVRVADGPTKLPPIELRR